MKLRKLIVAAAALLATSATYAQNDTMRWVMTDNGAIQWSVPTNKIPHYDHIEMSGEMVSTVLRYGVRPDGSWSVERSVVWPMLRTIPNNTHASLTRRFAYDPMQMITINGYSLYGGKVESVELNGIMTTNMTYGSVRTAYNTNILAPRKTVGVSVEYFPSTTQPAFCERYTLTNLTDRAFWVEVPEINTTYTTEPSQGVNGAYTLNVASEGHGTRKLAPGEKMTFGVVIRGRKEGEEWPAISVETELAARQAYLKSIASEMILQTPDQTLNRAFAFAKIRATESIYRTKGGLMHSPGGESYYAAIWANDQAEYANPLFGMMHYDKAKESALNSFRHFARYMNDEYRPIPSSIIAEGDSYWNGAGDRGDAAMIAYGAARYAMASGNRIVTDELMPLIEWCLEYCRRKITDDGVVASNSDELEGRFPAGKANLYTSSLYYDALVSTSTLCRELGRKADAKEYARRATEIRAAIESYYGATVEGYNTYRYYDGNDVLRSWICIPLAMGIYDRAEATLDALFSPTMFTPDGILTQHGSKTFWDRATEYALLGALRAGETERAIPRLQYMSRVRLLGEHVPYPIEAWPEGSQRHLSAESALYMRIITEGLFGIRPMGLNSFELSPRLPADWDKMSLCKVQAFGSMFDIAVDRVGNKIRVQVTKPNGTRITRLITDGASCTFSMK